VTTYAYTTDLENINDVLVKISDDLKRLAKANDPIELEKCLTGVFDFLVKFKSSLGFLEQKLRDYPAMRHYKRIDGMSIRGYNHDGIIDRINIFIRGNLFV
jgi:hypothetical protein